MQLEDLVECVSTWGDTDLLRLAMEYLPLAFSRRHGDPTRPWNRFSIDLTSSDGKTNLNYQGNWRDIFQNWEALAFSFPDFTTAMICRFVNATTADGYNPYRLTKDGFEWEEPSPEDPWANIGYWGDHQIIYLLKLLEWSRRLAPASLEQLLNQRVFTHANIPYRINDFEQIKKDPRDTILFDRDAAAEISKRVAEMGADGKLLQNEQGDVHYVTLAEKLFTLTLAKLANFIPDGGIWLNTQRPEWNDANNALVGSGLSMVTACYLYRWCKFLEEWFSSSETNTFEVSAEVATFLANVADALRQNETQFESGMDATSRCGIVETLSLAGSDFRNGLYGNGLSGAMTKVSREECLECLQFAKHALRFTIENNRREDGLYHSYNLLDWQGDEVEVEHLYEMLEGQVAVLTSGLLSSSEVIELLDALRSSSLYREDQNSYVLYPNRELPRFLEKNLLPDSAASIPLVKRLLEDGDARIVVCDQLGGLHFNGDFRNAADLDVALAALGPHYQDEVEQSRSDLITVFTEIFGHRQFTGRSGTFFAYEGLGSIYWHMVSKLGLAVSENLFWALDNNEPDEVLESLRSHLQEIRDGIGAEKSPQEYGAFPSDPYSHTPENAGVKQPGMTGQVKEDLLARFAELGVHIESGSIRFRLDLFDVDELLQNAVDFFYFDVEGQRQAVEVPADGFGFTFCQVPIVYQRSDGSSIDVHFKHGKKDRIDGCSLGQALSQRLFRRTGEITRIDLRFNI